MYPVLSDAVTITVCSCTCRAYGDPHGVLKREKLSLILHRRRMQDHTQKTQTPAHFLLDLFYIVRSIVTVINVVHMYLRLCADRRNPEKRGRNPDRRLAAVSQSNRKPPDAVHHAYVPLRRMSCIRRTLSDTANPQYPRVRPVGVGCHCGRKVT